MSSEDVLSSWFETSSSALLIWMVDKGHSSALGYRQCQWGCCGPFSSSFSPNKSFLLWLYPPALSELEAGAGRSHPVGFLGAETPWQTCLQVHVYLSVLLCPYVPLLSNIFLWTLRILPFLCILQKHFCFLQTVAFKLYKRKTHRKLHLKQQDFFPHIKTVVTRELLHLPIYV